MGVALGTLGGNTKDSFAHGVNAIKDAFNSKLLGLGPTFFVGHGIPEISSCNAIILSWIWNEVASDLFNDEVIIRHVIINRFDNPVAVEVHLSRQVLFIARRVGVAGNV